MDLNARPTNNVLRECWPEGMWDGHNEVYIPIHEDERNYLCLEVHVDTRVTLHIELIADDLTMRMAIYKHPLGHVSTIGEVIQIYELLSQKKWPGR